MRTFGVDRAFGRIVSGVSIVGSITIKSSSFTEPSGVLSGIGKRLVSTFLRLNIKLLEKVTVILMAWQPTGGMN
jgi:hypothetical protein